MVRRWSSSNSGSRVSKAASTVEVSASMPSDWLSTGRCLSPT